MSTNINLLRNTLSQLTQPATRREIICALRRNGCVDAITALGQLLSQREATADRSERPYRYQITARGIERCKQAFEPTAPTPSGADRCYHLCARTCRGLRICAMAR